MPAFVSAPADAKSHRLRRIRNEEPRGGTLVKVYISTGGQPLFHIKK